MSNKTPTNSYLVLSRQLAPHAIVGVRVGRVKIKDEDQIATFADEYLVHAVLTGHPPDKSGVMGASSTMIHIRNSHKSIEVTHSRGQYGI